MRIIGGKLKRKNISFLKVTTTRPLKDSVKESIFNVLVHSNLLNISLNRSIVLDLYSGIGSFGIECFSRETEHVTFVEKDRKVAETLKKNLQNLKLLEKSSVIVDDINSFLKSKQSKKFNIIFLDPPFADKTFIDQLKIIKEKRIYKNNHIIIIHRDKKSKEDFSHILKTLITKQYGRSKIIFAKFLN